MVSGHAANRFRYIIFASRFLSSLASDTRDVKSASVSHDFAVYSQLPGSFSLLPFLTGEGKKRVVVVVCLFFYCFITKS